MDVSIRLAESEQAFEKLKVRKEELTTQINEIIAEMNRLQGEYRVLTSMQQESTKEVDAAEDIKVDVIDEGVQNG